MRLQSSDRSSGTRRPAVSVDEPLQIEALERRLLLAADPLVERLSAYGPDFLEGPAGPDVVSISIDNWLRISGTVADGTSSAFSLRNAAIDFTDLPAGLDVPTIQLPRIDAFDDNADGIVDGVALDFVQSLGDIGLSMADTAFLTLDELTLGVQGFEARIGGVRAGQIIFDANGLDILPLDGATSTLALPGIGSVDINTGAFDLDLTVPEQYRKSLTLSGFVPFELTRIEASYSPGQAGPDVAVALTGVATPDQLATRIGNAIGSPDLTVGLEIYDEDSMTFVANAPLRLGLTYNDDGFALTDTPPVRLTFGNLDIPLPSSLGDLELSGWIAIGGFDSLGLPAPMPTELGAPYAGQQIAGNLTGTSTSSIGTVTGALTVGGSLNIDGSVTTLDLDFNGTLTGNLSISDFTGTGSFAADVSLPITIDNTSGDPVYNATPNIDAFRASDLDLTLANILRLQIASITYADPATVMAGDPVASMNGATLTFSDLPLDLGTVAIALDDIDGYDDNQDGIIDGFGLSASIDLTNTFITVGGKTLISIGTLSLGVNGLQVRPENGGFRSGSIDFAASGIQLLPAGPGPRGPSTFDLPDIGSVDINTGAFDLDLTVPEQYRKSLTLSGFVPFELTRIEASYSPGQAGPDVAVALTGVATPDQLATRIGNAIGSPDLTVGLEIYDEDSMTFVANAPLRLGLTYNDDGFALTDTPPVRLTFGNLDIPLPSSLGDLELSGWIAIGGFDSLGLPAPMPTELGAPYAGQQIAGNLTGTSTSSIGTVTGSLTVGGSLNIDGSVTTLDLDFNGTLAGNLSISDFTGTGSFAADVSLPITIDNTSGDPVYNATPHVDAFRASDLDLTLANILRLQIASITYADPATVMAGDPVASMNGATLTFSDLPLDLGTVAIALDDIDGYDDNQDGIIDGFGLSASIDLTNTSITVGGKTLISIGTLSLGVNGLQVRPENGGFRSGSIDFAASGIQLLPAGPGPRGPSTFDLPDIGSVDINTGAFDLDLTVPEQYRKSLTLSGFVPFELTRIEASYSPGQAGPDVAVALTGVATPDQLATRIGNAIGSPDLTVGLEIYDEDSMTFVANAPLRLGLTYNDDGFALTDTPPVRLTFGNLDIPLPSSLGDLELSGWIAIGGFDSLGLPAPMPTELGAPYAGQQIAGNLTGTSTSSIGTVTGSLTVGGSLNIDGSVTTLDLDFNGTLAGNLSISDFTGTGSFAADVSLPITIDNTNGDPVYNATPNIDAFRASDLTLSIADVIELQIDSIDYADPATVMAGDPIASATGITATLLGVFADANASAAIDLDLYDDSLDGIIDGVGITNAVFTFAQGQPWTYGDSADPLFSVTDLSATFGGFEYRPELDGFTVNGSISLALGTLELFPNGTQAFTASLTNSTGSIDPQTGDVSLDIGTIDVGIGPGGFFQVQLLNTSFTLDTDETTDILTVGTASLTLDDIAGEAAGIQFEVTNFRFNLVNNQPRFGLDTVALSSPSGVLTSLGLSGFLPFDITDATLAFSQDGSYTDFNAFTLDVEGTFDFSLLDGLLPFDPILSIGGTNSQSGNNANVFNVSLGFNIAERRIVPLSLQDIRVGFSEFQIGDLVLAGELLFDGYSNGVLSPNIGGYVSIDTASADSTVQPANGSGIDLHGAQISLDGTVTRSNGTTSIVIDAQAGLSFDLRLGDFLNLSDLGFTFGLDIEAPDNWRADPFNLVAVSPRLDETTVGTLTAGLGDFISLGAVPGSGGQPGLRINFDPEQGEPLAELNFNIQSPLIGLSGTVNNLRILEGGIPDFGAIDRIDVSLISRSDGSASLLEGLFSEFLPLGVTGIGFNFLPDFFEYAPGGSGLSGITGINDPTALNLFLSGRAGVPDWLPSEIPFDVGTDFSDLEISLTDLINGQFPIVSLAGLGFEVGIDFGAFVIQGGLSVGVVDADPGPGVSNIYYAAIEGELSVGDYGGQGALALTTAGPIGVTISVPLAITLGQTGIVISGVAGTIQFGTVLLPDPDDIQAPSDLSAVPNPFDISLTDSNAIRDVAQGLWDPTTQSVDPTWTRPATLALQGEITHLAVAGVITGTATIGANISLPIGGNPTEPGLALLGFADIRALGIPVADATLVFDLRDELNPSVGFYFQAPSDSNPLGLLFPAQADFGVLLKTDGLAMATATALHAVVSELANGTLTQGQLFFEAVSGQILDTLQQNPGASELASLLAPHLPAGTTFADLTTQTFLELLRDQLLFDDVLSALGAAAGLNVTDLAPALQEKLVATTALANALVADLLTFMPRVIGEGLDSGLTTGENLVALGLRNAAQQNDPLDPLGLLSSLDAAALAVSRAIPLEYVSEATSLLVSTISSAFSSALDNTAAFILSDAFDPRLLVEGAIQPAVLGFPVGSPVGAVQMTVSKRGVSYGFTASILDTLQLLGTAPLGPLSVFMNGINTNFFSDSTTIAYELPFEVIDTLQALTDGELPLEGLNPFSPEWGMLASMEILIGGITSTASLVQFGPGSTLLENNVQIVDDFDDPVDPGNIPVTSQELLDRMRSLGGFLFTGGVYQPKLLTDPFEVINNIITTAQAAGQVFESAEDEFQYLSSLFTDGPGFLQAIQSAILEVEEFGRGQAYLPLSYETLLPQPIRDLLNGDPAAFNDAFRTEYFNPDGSINSTAVADAISSIGADIQNSGSTIATNMFFEGLINANLFGLDLANARFFGGVLPDPDNPGQTLDFGNTALTITAALPWLGNLGIEALLDTHEFTLPPVPGSGIDPFAALRAVFGDTIAIPRARLDVALDTAASGGPSDFETALASLGLNTSLFTLPSLGQADARLRAYTPGYDIASTDPLLRAGGIEFFANLNILGLVENAAFTFRVGQPTADGMGGYLTPFSASATVGNATVGNANFGGVNIANATITLTGDASGLRIHVAGTTTVLGAAFTVDGELDSNLHGSLTMSLDSGQTLANAFGGLSGSGTFNMVSDASGVRVAFNGSLSNIPGLGGSISALGDIQPTGDFSIATTATNLTLAGFAVSNTELQVVRIGTVTTIQFQGAGSLSALGVTFTVSGSMSTTGAASLTLTRTVGVAAFASGITASTASTFALVTTSDQVGSLTYTGTIYGTPGDSSLAYSGTISSNGDFRLDSSTTNLFLAGFNLTNARLRFERSGAIADFRFISSGSLAILSTSFNVSGTLSTSGSGLLTMSLASFSPRFSGFTASGLFQLSVTNGSSGNVSFVGTVNGLPGTSGGALSSNGVVHSDGDFDLSAFATLNFAGFSVTSAQIAFARTNGSTSLLVDGRTVVLGAVFDVNGTLNTASFGNLSMTLLSGTPDFDGFSLSGSFTLDINGYSSAEVDVSGTLSNIPDVVDSIALSGSIASNGTFSLTGSVNELTIAPNGTSNGNVWADISASLTLAGTSTSASITGSGSINILESRIWGFFGTTPLYGVYNAYGTMTMDNLTIRSDGYVDLDVTNLAIGLGAVTVSSSNVSFTVDPTFGYFRLSIISPTLTLNNVIASGNWSRTFSSFTINFDGGADFERQVVDGDASFLFGGFSLSGTDLLVAYDSGVYTLRLRDDAGRTSQLNLLGNLGSFNLPDVTISSDGTFAVNISNPTIGPSIFNVTAPSMTFEKTSSSYSSLRVNIPSPTINLPLGGTAPLGEAIQFNSNGTLSDNIYNIATSLLDLGSFFRVFSNQSSYLDFNLRTTAAGWEFSLINSTGPSVNLTAGSTNARITEFTVDANGNFSGNVNAELGVMVNGILYTLASADLSLFRTSSYVQLTVSDVEVDLNFFEMDVSGYVRSNGDFNLAGSTTVDIDIDIVTVPAGTPIAGLSAELDATIAIDLDTFGSVFWDMDVTGSLLVTGPNPLFPWLTTTYIDISSAWSPNQLTGNFSQGLWSFSL